MALSATKTTPYEFTAGEIVLASQMNTIQENVLWLQTPPVDTQSISSTTTTSASFVAVTGVTLTITTTGGDVAIWFSGQMQHDTGGVGSLIDIGVDGTGQGDATNGLAGFTQTTTTYVWPITIFYVKEALAAGSHTFTLRWKTGSGTLTLRTGGQFGVREI